MRIPEIPWDKAFESFLAGRVPQLQPIALTLVEYIFGKKVYADSRLNIQKKVHGQSNQIYH